jgi:prepilin-type N-terminal cleavage/methylation domain-containing protein
MAASKRNNGMSLIEVLMAISISGFLFAILIYLFIETSRSQQLFKMLMQRDRIAAEIKGYLLDRPLSDSTIDANINLRNCVRGLVADGCPHNVETGFVLFDPDRPLVPVAGSPPSPIYYDREGQRCTGRNVRCPIVVFVTFTAFCPLGNTGDCDRAVTFKLRYHVGQSPNWEGEQMQTRPIDTSFTRSLEEVSGTSVLCVAPLKFRGTRNDGSVICTN